jgi:selenocysteine-specific elongation factor
LLEDLVTEGLAVGRGPAFLPAAGPSPDPLAERVVDTLAGDHLEPRGAEALGAALGVSTDEAREALERAALDGRLVRVKPGVYYFPPALAEAERVVCSLCERDGSVTIARLRDELGASRKYAQALLEHFDSRRLTRRQGDEHVLRRAAGRSV